MTTRRADFERVRVAMADELATPPPAELKTPKSAASDTAT